MKIDQSYQTKSRSTSNNAEQSGTLQRKVSSLDALQLLADNSSQVTQLKTLSKQINKKADPVQLKKTETSDQKRLPEKLGTGVEQLSGLDMGDVKVNYNSSKPSEIGAAAYAQGSDIHLGPGQEKHLPHEAWHVVQQKKGIVKSTGTINGTSVNEEKKLEHEADQMGIKAQGLGNNAASILQKVSLNIKDRKIIQKKDSEPTQLTVADPNAPQDAVTPVIAPNAAQDPATLTAAQKAEENEAKEKEAQKLKYQALIQEAAKKGGEGVKRAEADQAAKDQAAKEKADQEAKAEDDKKYQEAQKLKYQALIQEAAKKGGEGVERAEAKKIADALAKKEAEAKEIADAKEKADQKIEDKKIEDKRIEDKRIEDEKKKAQAAKEAAAGPILVQYRGLVDMAKNADSILNHTTIWTNVVAGTNIIEDAASTVESAASVTAEVAGVPEVATGADKIADHIAGSFGSSILAVFGVITSIINTYKGFKKGDRMALAEGQKDFVAAVKSGLETANNIMKAVGSVVNPAIVAAIPGLGIVVSAADLLINLSNAMTANKAQVDMTSISDIYREQLNTSLEGPPEIKANKLFQIESRGKMFNRKNYLRLKPTILLDLEKIASSNNIDADFEEFKKDKKFTVIEAQAPTAATPAVAPNAGPSAATPAVAPNAGLTFNDFYTAVRTYELGSKLQEINQKRKVHGNTGIMVSLISIAGDIALFFPADGGITAATLKGTAMAISGGKAAGKFFQQKSRNKGWFGGDKTRSTNAKHNEYVQSVKSIYFILAQSKMKDKEDKELSKEEIDKIVPVQSMISATGASPKSVYNTNYGDEKSKLDQVKLLVERMKQGRG